MYGLNGSRKPEMITIHERQIIPESIEILDIYVAKKPLECMCAAAIFRIYTLWQGGQMISNSSNFELPIRFPLAPSKWLAGVIYLSHLGALVCIYFSNISVLLLQTTSLVVILNLAYWHYKVFYQLKKNPAELILNSKDEWYISEGMNEVIPVILLPESFVHTHLIVLTFRQGRRKRTVILTPDNISNTTCRRLRVRLRFTLSGERS